MKPPPNLYHATFEQANRQPAGSRWLEQRIKDFDAGGKKRRKEVVEEFLAYVQESGTPTLEELFSNTAQLFLVRLASWFAVTLPVQYELALQLKVLLAFLEFREPPIVREFFGSGLVVSLMNALSRDYDAPDDVRCLALVVFLKLARQGRHYKEQLCAHGLVTNILECVSDGLHWDTLKSSGRLLCELFHSNSSYQPHILDALLWILTTEHLQAKRVALQAFTTLLATHSSKLPPSLIEEPRTRSIVEQCLLLMESKDLHVTADAYGLLCQLVRQLNCDELLYDFAHEQLHRQHHDTELWLKVELSAIEDQATSQAKSSGPEDPSLGQLALPCQQMHLVNRLQSTMAGAVSSAVNQGSAESEQLEGLKLIQLATEQGATISNTVREQAGDVLRWSLLIFLAKRNSDLCDRLVEEGLTETLLMYVLDGRHPVRQAAALEELHRLQLLSHKAFKITEIVLGKKEMVRALNMDQFMGAGSPEDIARARFRLRSHHSELRERLQACGASELVLQQRLFEQGMGELFGRDASKDRSSKGTVFLTDGAGEAATTTQEEKSEEVPRAGNDRFDVRRVPVPPATGEPESGTRGRAVRRGYSLSTTFKECEGVQSVLKSFPGLNILGNENEEESLLKDAKEIEQRISLNIGRRKALPPLSKEATKKLAAAKTEDTRSQRPSLQHARAMALRKMPPLGIDRPTWNPPKMATRTPSLAASEFSMETELSLRCEGPADPLPLDDLSIASFLTKTRSTMRHSHHSGCGCTLKPSSTQQSKIRPPLEIYSSMADTSLGPELTEFSNEFSLEFASAQFAQTSLAAEDFARYTIDTESFMEEPSLTQLSQEKYKDVEFPPLVRVTQRSGVTAVIEVPRTYHTPKGEVVASPRAARRILHVIPAPVHNCLAFNRSDFEEERSKAVENVCPLAKPATKLRLEELKLIGSFPRLTSVAKRRCRPIKLADMGPFSARGSLVRLAPPDPEASEHGEDVVRELHESALDPEEYEAPRTISSFSLNLQLPESHKVETLRDYFPASARAVLAGRYPRPISSSDSPSDF